MTRFEGKVSRPWFQRAVQGSDPLLDASPVGVALLAWIISRLAASDLVAPPMLSGRDSPSNKARVDRDSKILSSRELSAREAEIVRRAMTGMSNKTIGYDLSIAPSTVATHVAAAMKKLGATSRLELFAAFARDRSGLHTDLLGYTDDTLTVKQRLVAGMWVRGCKASEVAAAQGCAVGTVRKHVESIYRRLGVGSRGELLARLGAREESSNL